MQNVSTFLLIVLGIVSPTLGEGQVGSSLFSWDHNLSFFVSRRGADLPATAFSHIQPTDRIPRNYIGFEYAGQLDEESWLRKRLDLTTFDLNPHLEIDFNPMNTRVNYLKDLPIVDFHPMNVDFNYADGHDQLGLRLVLHDFWFRFEPKGLERTSLRIGHFDIPYGMNPVMSMRGGQFIMPLEVDDLGFKKDWGISWKGPMGAYDYELAATIGSGLGIHSPHWFGDKYPGAYVLSGRFGAPTYWKFHYGISGLWGQIPPLMGDQRMGGMATGSHMYLPTNLDTLRSVRDWAKATWRLGADAFYRHSPYLVFMAQIGAGRTKDSPQDQVPGWKNALAGGFLIDFVPPRLKAVNLKIDTKAIFSDLGGFSNDHIYTIFETAYSLSNAMMVRMDYVHDFRVPETSMLVKDDRIYFGLSYYR